MNLIPAISNGIFLLVLVLICVTYLKHQTRCFLKSPVLFGVNFCRFADARRLAEFPAS